jgi:hypothetical protein
MRESLRLGQVLELEEEHAYVADKGGCGWGGERELWAEFAGEFGEQ